VEKVIYRWAVRDEQSKGGSNVAYRLQAGLNLTRRGHPLLDDGSVTRFLYHCLGDKRVHAITHIEADCFLYNGYRTLSVSAIMNTLVIGASENKKLKGSTCCLLDRPADIYNRLSRHCLLEAGSNTSTVTLRVVGGEEKGSL
jgi:hypothetical protein